MAKALVFDDSLSRHARARMRQRGIGGEALDILLAYGREAFDHRGSTIVYFDKAARQRLEREAAPEVRKEVGRLSCVYAVLSGAGKVVTVGHRYRRINRG